MKKMLFFPDGILVPTTCDIRKISFANEFSQIDLVRTLIICLYYIDAPVVGSMATVDWLCTCRFVASTATCCDIGSTFVTCALVLYRCFACFRSYLFPVYWPRRYCFTSSFNVLVYFSLLFLMMELSGLDWEVSALCYYIPCLDPPLEVGLSDLPPLGVYSSY